MLSIQQPYATAILHKIKTVENRKKRLFVFDPKRDLPALFKLSGQNKKKQVSEPPPLIPPKKKSLSLAVSSVAESNSNSNSNSKQELEEESDQDNKNVENDEEKNELDTNTNVGKSTENMIIDEGTESLSDSNYNIEEDSITNRKHNSNCKRKRPISKAIRKKRKYKHLCEDPNPMCTKTSFIRLVREISNSECHSRSNVQPKRWQKEAIFCLQESAEHYLTDYFRDVNIVCLKRGAGCSKFYS